MTIRITTLIENTAAMRLLAEWGLSILIETQDLKILLDTGPGFSTVHNGHLLGIDFKTIDKIVLSHGHFDHTGGLRDILKISGGLDVLCHPAVWEPKYAVRENKSEYIGIPFKKEELESLGANFLMSTNPVWITDNIVTSGEVPLLTGYEEIDSILYVKNGEKMVPDNLLDDLSLAIKTESGLAVILGCAHRGMINTINHFREITGVDRVYTIIGGTHLISASDERLNHTVLALKKMGVQKLGVSHCTGFKASLRLAEEFGDIFFLNNSGSRNEF